MIAELENNSYKLVNEIQKGWSSDKKYYIETRDNQKLLMRISDIELLESKAMEFEMMNKVFALGVPMSQPFRFGISEDQKHIYTLLSWIEGSDAEAEIPKLSIAEQYNLGYKAGGILKKIHTVGKAASSDKWGEMYNRKIEKKIKVYNDCPIKIPNGDRAIEYINENRHLLKGRPQGFQHGDYHIGNMILSDKNKLSIIDFNRCSFGDPWEEFNRISFCALKSPAFASGQINSYFDKQVPAKFFRLMALYISVNMLASVSWAVPYGKEEIDFMLNMSQKTMKWYDRMNDFVPSWYDNY